MEVINYITDVAGHRKAIVIDLEVFKRSGLTGRDVVDELLEDIEDLLDIEAVKDEETIPWEVAQAELRRKGLID